MGDIRNMFMSVFSLLLVLFAGIGYHLVSRKIPETGNHFFGVGMAYIVGFFVYMILFLFTKESSLNTELGQISWHYLLLGIMVPGIEIGFIAMYHSGWKVSKAALTADVLVTSILVLAGVLLFSEQLSWINILGVLICFSGVILLES